MPKLVRYRNGHTPEIIAQGDEQYVLQWSETNGWSRILDNNIFARNLNDIGRLHSLFNFGPGHDYCVLHADDWSPGKRHLPEIVVDPDGKRGWSGGGWCIAFVYSNRGNFVVKGYYREVVDRLDDMKGDGLRFFVCYTFWSAGKSRHFWYISARSAGLYAPDRKNRKWRVKVNDTVLSFRRIPRRWIAELDKFYETN